MGFKVGRVFAFEGEFKGTDAEGAHVRMRSASMQTVIDFRAAAGREEAEIIAAHLVDWDLEDPDGKPIPATVDGVMSLEMPLIGLIADEWMKATRAISVPFDRRSAGGEPSPTGDEPAPSIPMETL